jgi:hypothetical protein
MAKRIILFAALALVLLCALLPAQVSHVFGALDVANAWTGIQNFVNGFTYNGGAPSGNYMRGNGTAFVSYTIQQSDLPSTSTQTIAYGTVALPTTAISSGGYTLCSSSSCSGGTFTTSGGTIANVATSDNVLYTPNSDPTGVTGYGISSSGAVLSVYCWATSGGVSCKVGNSTSSSITPGSLTLNWRVTR